MLPRRCRFVPSNSWNNDNWPARALRGTEEEKEEEDGAEEESGLGLEVAGFTSGEGGEGGLDRLSAVESPVDEVVAAVEEDSEAASLSAA